VGSAVRKQYVPSHLPSPQKRSGVFIVRTGSSQVLVQGAFMGEDDSDRMAGSLPAKPAMGSPQVSVVDAVGEVVS
jgi:hypothetical protein